MIRHTTCFANDVHKPARVVQILSPVWVLFIGIGCSQPVNDLSDLHLASALHDQQRAEAALDRVRGAANLPARIVVDHADRLAAWSWADGTICVTRNFVERTSDDELTAIVAHELGHLCMARSVVSSETHFGFRGDGSLLIELQADEVGVRLLRVSGLTSEPLIKALSIVRDASQTTAIVRDELNLRIDALRDRN
jgi:hypothetical protein